MENDYDMIRKRMGGLAAVVGILWLAISVGLLIAGLWWLALILTVPAWWFVVRPMQVSWRRSLLVMMRDAGLPPANTKVQWRANIEKVKELRQRGGES